MESTIRYVFGLLGAMVASLIIYGLFMAGQGNMYEVMNNQLGTEYLMHTGNNGQMIASIRDSAWKSESIEPTDRKYLYFAYSKS